MLSKQKKSMTLDRFLVQRQSNQPGASGELTRVMVQLGIVAKIISSHVGRSTLEGLKGLMGIGAIQRKKGGARSVFLRLCSG